MKIGFRFLVAALWVLASTPASAEDLTDEQIAIGRKAVQEYLQAEDLRPRAHALQVLRGLGQPAVRHFKALLSLEERTLPVEPTELTTTFGVDTLTAITELQVPSAAQAGTALAPLMIVLMPSRLDGIEAGDDLAALIGGAFQQAGWIVAAPRPFKIDDELGFRADKSRPAFLRWTRGSGEVVPWLVAHLLRTLPIDPDRVHLLGFEDGADGALWVAGRYADRFASATAIDGRLSGKKPLRWVRNIGNLDVVVGYGIGERDWRPGEKGALLRLLRSHGVDTEFLPIVETEGFPAEALIERVAPLRRNTVDRIIRWFTDRPGYGRYEWASVDACTTDATIHIEADRETNQIQIHDARGVRAMGFRLDSLVLDPTRPVVVTHDGRRIYRGSPEPRIEELMDCWHRYGDLTRLYSRTIALQLR